MITNVFLSYEISFKIRSLIRRVEMENEREKPTKHVGCRFANRPQEQPPLEWFLADDLHIPSPLYHYLPLLLLLHLFHHLFIYFSTSPFVPHFNSTYLNPPYPFYPHPSFCFFFDIVLFSSFFLFCFPFHIVLFISN